MKLKDGDYVRLVAHYLKIVKWSPEEIIMKESSKEVGGLGVIKKSPKKGGGAGGGSGGLGVIIGGWVNRSLIVQILIAHPHLDYKVGTLWDIDMLKEKRQLVKISEKEADYYRMTL